MPKVSVCIPTHNCGHFISEAINSVLLQDFKDYELIISDNASTDNTKNIIDSYDDSRIKYFKNKHNIGFVNNLNLCIDLSNGEYIIFLCADDVWYPGILRKEVNVLDQNPRVVFVHTGFKHIGERSSKGRAACNRWQKIMSGTSFFREYFKGLRPVCLSSSMARIDFVRKIGGFIADFSNAADFAMWLRLALEGNVAYLKEVLTGYRIHSSSLSSKSSISDVLGTKKYYKIFEWPIVIEKGLFSLKDEIPKVSAFRIIKMLHNLQNTHFILKSFGEAVTVYPPILLAPTVWLRLCFSLIIPNTIRMGILQILYKFR